MLPVCGSFVVSGPVGSLYLSSPTCFSGLLGLHFFLLTGMAQVGAKGRYGGSMGLGWQQWNGGLVKEYRRCGSSADRCILFFCVTCSDWSVSHLFF